MVTFPIDTTLAHMETTMNHKKRNAELNWYQYHKDTP